MSLEFDLFPRDDPLNGARLVRFTKLQAGTEYRKEWLGTGAGQIVIRGDDAEAQFLDPRGDQYIRVFDTAVSTTVPIGGFWTDPFEFQAIDRKRTRKLTVKGPGTIACLAREIMLDESFVVGGFDPFDRIWRLHELGAGFGAGTPRRLGTFFHRVLAEAGVVTAPLGNQAGRPWEYLVDLGVTADFTDTQDSDATTWPTFDGEFIGNVGESILSVVQKLMQVGLFIEMDPHTFELHAYVTKGTDRSGAAWGAGVVRFQTASAGTVATGNIKSEAKRSGSASMQRSALLVGGMDDVWERVVASNPPASDHKWAGAYPMESADPTALTIAGEAQIAARSDAADTGRLRIAYGNSPTTGRYRPITHFDVPDIATLQSGSGAYDWNEEDHPIHAITWQKRRGGPAPDVFLDFGSTYRGFEDRQFATGGGGTCNCPRLCDPGYDCTDPRLPLTAQTATNGDAENGAGTEWSGGAYSTSRFHAGVRSYEATGASVAMEYDFGAQVFAVGVRYVIDVFRRIEIDHDVTTLRFGVDGIDDEVAVYQGVPGDDPPDLFLQTETGADGGTWNKARICWTPSAERTGVRLRFESTSFTSGWHAVDDLTLSTAPSAVAGTDSRAARCNHGHHHNDLEQRDAVDAHPATSVSITDAGGYYTGTEVEAALQEIGADLAGGLVTDHGDLTGLPDNDHPQYRLTTDGGQDVISVVAASGSTETLSLVNGNVHDVTLTANCTLTLAGATAGVECTMAVLLRQDGTGSRTVTWPGSVEWVGGSAPTLETAANAWNWITLTTLNGGTTWFGDAGTATSISADDVRDAGIWEVIVSGTAPPVATTNAAEDDWVYGWVSG